MNAQALQAHIEASQDLDALTYALRGLRALRGYNGNVSEAEWELLAGGARERQAAAGEQVARRLLRREQGPTEPRGSFLAQGLALAKAEAKSAKAERPTRSQLALSLGEQVERSTSRRAKTCAPAKATLVSTVEQKTGANVRRPTEEVTTMKSKTSKPSSKTSKPASKPASKPESKPEKITGPTLMRQVLEGAGRPLHNSIIAERVIAADRERKPAQRSYRGATPEQTISAALTMSHLRGATFVKTEPGCFALRHWTAAKLRKAAERPERKTPASKPAKRPTRNGIDAQAAAHTTVISPAKPASRSKPASKPSKPAKARKAPAKRGANLKSKPESKLSKTRAALAA